MASCKGERNRAARRVSRPSQPASSTAASQQHIRREQRTGKGRTPPAWSSMRESNKGFGERLVVLSWGAPLTSRSASRRCASRRRASIVLLFPLKASPGACVGGKSPAQQRVGTNHLLAFGVAAFCAGGVLTQPWLFERSGDRRYGRINLHGYVLQGWAGFSAVVVACTACSEAPPPHIPENDVDSPLKL